MKYETATDADLNHRLLELLHGSVVNHWSLSDDETFIYDCGPTGEGFYKIELRDYCNDWNATMPLAIENKISVRYLDGVECWVSDQVFDNQCGVYSSFSHFQVESGGEILEQTTLRTIVISLIKVLEAKNDAGQKS